MREVLLILYGAIAERSMRHSGRMDRLFRWLLNKLGFITKEQRRLDLLEEMSATLEPVVTGEGLPESSLPSLARQLRKWGELETNPSSIKTMATELSGELGAYGAEEPEPEWVYQYEEVRPQEMAALSLKTMLPRDKLR